MLSLTPNRKTATAVEEHLKAFTCRLNKKIKNLKCKNIGCLICNSTNQSHDIPYKLQNLLSDSFVLETIISGVPKELIEINTLVWNEAIENYSVQEYCLFLNIKNKSTDAMTDVELVTFAKYYRVYGTIRKLFDYESWFQNSDNENRYDSYALAFNLNRNTCTYCNRIYTSTIKDVTQGKVTRPQFDHWFGQTKYPLLAISFFNLVPSCSYCNSSIKNDIEFDLTTHSHPYVDMAISDDFVFSYDYSRSSDLYEIKIVQKGLNSKSTRLLYDLNTRNVYNSHQLELKDLILIKKNYTTNYLNGLISAFPAANLNHKEIYRLAFGVELEAKDYYKLPLSKFKKDILIELGIII